MPYRSGSSRFSVIITPSQSNRELAKANSQKLMQNSAADT
jgi:hypothetical protein